MVTKKIIHKEADGTIIEILIGANAENVEEDSEHRFVSDEEKNLWNANVIKRGEMGHTGFVCNDGTVVNDGEAEEDVLYLSGASLYVGRDGSFERVCEWVRLGETVTTAYRGDRGKIAYDHSQSPHAPAPVVLYDGEITSGSTTMQDSFMYYSDIELLCVTTGTAYPFAVKLSVGNMHSKDLVISHVTEKNYLQKATINFAGSGKTLTVKDNEVINLSTGSTVPIGSGIKIYKVIGYKSS